MAAHSDKPAYILPNLAGSEAIECEQSFMAEIKEPGEDGRVLVPAKSMEDPECLKRKFREMYNPQTNINHEKTQIQPKG